MQDLELDEFTALLDGAHGLGESSEELTLVDEAGDENVLDLQDTLVRLAQGFAWKLLACKQGQYLAVAQQGARVLGKLWMLPRVQGITGSKKVAAVKASMEFSRAVLWLVVEDEKKLKKSVEDNLGKAIKAAALVYSAMNVATMTMCDKETEGDAEFAQFLSEAQQDGLEMLESIFCSTKVLYGVLRDGIIASRQNSSCSFLEGLLKIADSIAAIHVVIVKMCANPKAYALIAEHHRYRVLELIHAGLGLLRPPIGFARMKPTDLIPSSCCEGRVELLIARCVALLAQLLNKPRSEPYFLEKLGKGKLKRLFITLLDHLVGLFKLMFERSLTSVGSKSSGETQLLYSILLALVEASDTVEARAHLMNKLSPIVSHLFLTKKVSFQARLCGGNDSLLVHIGNDLRDHEVDLHTPGFAETKRKLSKAVNAFTFYFDSSSSELNTTPEILREAQVMALLRSALFARVISNLAMTAPNENENLFANLIYKSINLEAQNFGCKSKAEFVWRNMHCLIEFLSPLARLKAFPFGMNTLKAVQKLGHSICALGSAGEKESSPIVLDDSEPDEMDRDDEDTNAMDVDMR